jgi:hypothetical protein
MNSRVGSNLFQASGLFNHPIPSLWIVYLQIVYVVAKTETDGRDASAG